MVRDEASMMQFQNSFDKITEGVQRFQSQAYKERETLFKNLAKGQEPKILFITCSDSRISPSLITQTEPGDMFLIHNAGNIVPPHGAAYGGTGASIEYAVSVLNVEHVIVCGHSGCGAMNALMSGDPLDNLPAVNHWLSFAEGTKAILESDARAKGENNEMRLERCIRMNIPVQLAHLRTLPSIAAKLMQKQIEIHGWVYEIESGEIEVYNSDDHTFVPFEQAYGLQTAAAGPL